MYAPLRIPLSENPDKIFTLVSLMTTFHMEIRIGGLYTSIHMHYHLFCFVPDCCWLVDAQTRICGWAEVGKGSFKGLGSRSAYVCATLGIARWKNYVQRDDGWRAWGMFLLSYLSLDSRHLGGGSEGAICLHFLWLFVCFERNGRQRRTLFSVKR